MDGMSIRVVRDGRDMDNMWSSSSFKLRSNTIDGFFRLCIQYPLSPVHSSTNNYSYNVSGWISEAMHRHGVKHIPM
jgi:hypothetical protein